MFSLLFFETEDTLWKTRGRGGRQSPLLTNSCPSVMNDLNAAQAGKGRK